MALLAALLASVLAMALAYEMLPASASVRVEQYETLAGLRQSQQGKAPFWRTLLLPFNRLAARLPASLSVRTRRQLYWAQRGDDWLGWDEASVLGLRLAGATLGALLAASSSLGITAASALLGWWLPGMLLAGRARRVERGFRRELPDTAHLLSMLVAAGLSVEQALERLAEQPGLVSGWLAEGLALARGHRRMDALGKRAGDTGLTDLTHFVAQLAEVERAGTSAGALLEGLAEDLAGAYRAQSLRRAKAVGSQLILPILVFYLVPYLLAVGAPMAASMVRLFQ